MSTKNCVDLQPVEIKFMSTFKSIYDFRC